MGILDRFKNIIKFDRVTIGTSSTTSPQTTELSTLKVTELKALAKERGLKGYTKLKKAELLALLNE